jgi:hypothetical protein
LVHARDRIGRGPWKNANGVVVAGSVDELHGSNNLNKQTEKADGAQRTRRGCQRRGDTPNQHDMPTGSTADGRAADATCDNGTLSGEGSAIVGHHDRIGLNDLAPAKTWNASHPSRGRSQKALVTTGGAGLTYCFSINRVRQAGSGWRLPPGRLNSGGLVRPAGIEPATWPSEGRMISTSPRSQSSPRFYRRGTGGPGRGSRGPYNVPFQAALLVCPTLRTA